MGTASKHLRLAWETEPGHPAARCSWVPVCVRQNERERDGGWGQRERENERMRRGERKNERKTMRQ